ncbi:MAG: ATP-binding protein [Abditibacteriales bacterium]|nr:ATP-binding protein [Abditibacteriales bacterium]MDW8364399.1 ATP-binding protein [Abditibacteriales bacterium]
MGRSTRRGSLDELRNVCNALNSARDADELATVLAKYLVNDLAFEQVVFLIPQTGSDILCLTAARHLAGDASPPLRFQSVSQAMSCADRAWLEYVSATASPEIDANLRQTSSLYRICSEQLGSSRLWYFPLRCRQHLWAVLALPARTKRRQEGEHILSLLTVLTQFAESVLERVHPAAPQPSRDTAQEYDGNEIVGVLAHELRNPLNSIKAAAQFLRAKYSDHASIYKFLNIIIDEVDHLSSLTTTLLEFARPLQLDKVHYDINALLRHLLHFMGHVFTQHHIEVTTALASNLPYVSIDVKQMEQAIRNGLLNAIEAMPQGGHLHVATQCGDGRTVQIHLIDSGMGIPQDETDKVFASFYTTKPNGTGLGLPILHKIVRSHGGGVSLESKPGVGTSLTIWLPAAETAPHPAASRATLSQAMEVCGTLEASPPVRVEAT